VTAEERGEAVETTFVVADPRFEELVPADAELRRLWTGGEWVEGPAVLPDGTVVWSDIPNERVLRMAPDGSVRVDAPSHFANGHTVDPECRLVRCEHGRRQISRVAEDGSTTTVVDRFEGGRLNSPNDVVVKSDGTIWFSDPPYGILSDREGHKAPSEQAGNFVFRFDPATEDLRVASGDFIEEPNGLAFSPDESLLYVSDTSAALRDEGGNHHIVAFDVTADGRLENPRVFAEIEEGLADGFRVDAAGNVFTSSAGGILVYTPEGELLGRIVVPEMVSNCAFGGPDGRRLYITASSSLYAIELSTRGAVVASASGASADGR
jgi:gluconolactonase